MNLNENPSAISQTQPSQTQYPHFPGVNSNGNPQGNAQYGNFGGRGGYFRGRGPRGGCFRGHGGRGSGRAYIQCQICYKTGHDASICYHRLSVPPSYEGYGVSGVYGASSGILGPPPNVWMQGMQCAPTELSIPLYLEIRGHKLLKPISLVLIPIALSPMFGTLILELPIMLLLMLQI